MMLLDSMLAVIQNHDQPAFLFCTGLCMSILFCLLTMTVESTIRRRQFAFADARLPDNNYQRFRHDLISTSRHIGFNTDEIYELHDRDFFPRSPIGNH